MNKIAHGVGEGRTTFTHDEHVCKLKCEPHNTKAP